MFVESCALITYKVILFISDNFSHEANNSFKKAVLKLNKLVKHNKYTYFDKHIYNNVRIKIHVFGIQSIIMYYLFFS